MKPRAFTMFILVVILQISSSHSKIMRNNALMQKMITHFQDKPSPDAREPGAAQKPVKLLYVMQNVLCRNFPTIPCKVITQDLTLKNLIERSIDQINNKKRNIENTTKRLRNYQRASVESNFIPLADDRFFTNKNVQTWTKEDTKANSMKAYQTNDKQSQSSKKTGAVRNEYQKSPIYGHKNLRKFYPHKIKYPGKNNKKTKYDYSEEKISMSVEVPDMTLTKQHQHLNYKVEPADPPVWRIDYMKHGEPSFNRFGYQGSSLDKIVKNGPGVVDEHLLQHAARKDVMHPDVYIKKKFSRQNVVDNNSEIIE